VDGKVENRGQLTHHRGEVAIHATKAVDQSAMGEALAAGKVGPFTVLGAVLAVADLVGCHLADQDSGTTCCQPYGLRMWGQRPAYHLVFANVRRLPTPVEVRGQLGFWRLPPDVEHAVRRQLSPTTTTPEED
jgi:hypothetical protein